MESLQPILADWRAEGDVLDRVVSDLRPDQWEVPSPAEGWLLRDCVAHLPAMDEIAVFAIRNRRMPELSERRHPSRGDVPDDGVLAPEQLWARDLAPADLLAWWRAARAELAAALASLTEDDRIPWGPTAMKPRSFLTGRILEYWSHGLDILDAAGVAPVDTDRLKHVAHIGYITREFAYRNRGLTPPSTPLRVALTSPSGETWTWGPEDAPDRIAGGAGDFCRVVSQRIHYLDTDLRAEGPLAEEFLRVAQAFAGPSGQGRPPKTRASTA